LPVLATLAREMRRGKEKKNWSKWDQRLASGHRKKGKSIARSLSVILAVLPSDWEKEKKGWMRETAPAKSLLIRGGEEKKKENRGNVQSLSRSSLCLAVDSEKPFPFSQLSSLDDLGKKRKKGGDLMAES